MKRFRIVAVSAVWLGVMVFTLDRINISMAAPKIMDDPGISGAQMGMISLALLLVGLWGCDSHRETRPPAAAAGVRRPEAPAPVEAPPAPALAPTSASPGSIWMPSTSTRLR